jgi:membrane protease YdiL (CAAX protease family)
MLERKPLRWFLVIAFAISWPLFLAPLLFPGLDSNVRLFAIQGVWALAMWGPGIAALVATLAVAKQSFTSLRLNTLGLRRYYLWAWLLPPVMVVFSGLLTMLLRTGRLDIEFKFMQQMMSQAGTQLPVSTGMLVLIQIVQALLLAPLINIVFTMGEELGWRGFLLPRLMPLGQWKALLISGTIWGVWHAPVIAQGYNYPDHPILGILLMTVFCTLFGIIIGWMYLNTRSPWVAALGHASLNAWAGLPFFFLEPGFDTALGGTLTSLPGWVVMCLFIVWLVLTKRLPVQTPTET